MLNEKINHNDFPVFSLRSLLHDSDKMRQEMNFALILFSAYCDSSAELTWGTRKAFTCKENLGSVPGTRKVNIKQYHVKWLDDCIFMWIWSFERTQKISKRNLRNKIISKAFSYAILRSLSGYLKCVSWCIIETNHRHKVLNRIVTVTESPSVISSCPSLENDWIKSFTNKN